MVKTKNNFFRWMVAQFGLPFLSFLITALSVIGIWVFFLGQNILSDSLGGMDAVTYLGDLKHLIPLGFNWKNFLYRHELLGGSPIFYTYGIRKFFVLASFFLSEPIVIFNAYIISFQILFGYLAGKSVLLVKKRLSPEANLTESYWTLFFQLGILSLLFAFLPIWGLRFTQGHVNPEFLFIPLIFFLFYSRNKSDLTVFDLFLIVIAFFIILPPTGQMFVYVLLFSLPLVIAFFLGEKNRGDFKNFLLIFSLFILSAGAVGFSSLPEFLERYNFIGEGNLSRSLNEKVVYTYATLRPMDFLEGLTFMLNPFSRTDLQKLHETNYPLGAFLLFLFFLYRKNQGYLFFGLLLTGLFVYSFAMDLFPLSDGLLFLAPVLKGFRVPARAIPVFSISLLVLGLGAYLSQIEKKSLKVSPIIQGALLLLMPTIFYGPVLLREIVVWSFGILLLFSFSRNLSWRPHFSLVLLVFLSYNLSAFSERFRPSNINREVLSFLENIKTVSVNNFPGMKNSLNRVYLKKELVASSTLYLMGFSNPGGYRLFSNRQRLFLSAMVGEEISPETMNFRLKETMKNFGFFREAYNVIYSFDLDLKTNGISVKKKELITGPVFFPKTLEGRTGMKEVVLSLVEDFKQGSFGEKAYLISSQKNNPLNQGLSQHFDCRAMNPQVQANLNDQNIKITLKTSVSTNCLMVIKSNYVSNIHGYSQNKKLKTFPINGTFIGIIVPEGVKEIVVGPELRVSVKSLSDGGYYLFSTLFIVLAFRFYLRPKLSAFF